MSFRTAADVPLQVTSENSSSERRISPSWSVAQLRTRLEPITGIPASSQRLSLRTSSQSNVAIEAADEEATQLSSFPLQAYSEIHVQDTRPPSARTNFTDVSAVPKYTMPTSTYESLPNSVLAWKKNQKLGRFDPAAPGLEEQKVRALEREIEERGITLHSRCRLLPSTDARRGTISYIGPVPSLPASSATAASAPWIGVALDEPTGKNDGSVGGQRYFSCGRNCGVFVRPERVEVGEFPVLGLEGEDGGSDMEEM